MSVAGAFFPPAVLSVISFAPETRPASVANSPGAIEKAVPRIDSILSFPPSSMEP